MAIYLDANVLYGWRSFAEADRLALSIVATQLGQQVIVPWVAAEEAAANFRRSLEQPLADLDRAQAAVLRVFGTEFDFLVEPVPDVEDEVDRWRTTLHSFAVELEAHGGDARQALHREMYGIPPARRTPKGGVGARDAAIWLAVARHYRDADEPGHLITGNSKDFAIDGRLHPALQAEVQNTGHGLRLHDGIAPFLQQLGTPHEDVVVSLQELKRRAAPAVMQGLKDSALVLRPAVATAHPRWRLGADVLDASPLSVSKVQRYERDGDSVTMVDAQWGLEAQIRFVEQGTSFDRSWGIFDDVPLRGAIQVYLPDSTDAGKEPVVIGAQLRSLREIEIYEDGSGMSWDSAD